VGVPSIDEGLIDLPLAKQPGSGGEKMMVDKSEQGQPARSRYRVIERAGNTACWMELQPFTGRTHQLRVHLAAIGHPIVGDGKYGGPDAFLSGSISRKMHLHARRIIIPHPDGTPLDVEAELPEHFAASLAQLGFNEADGEYIPDTSGDLTREDRSRSPRPTPSNTARNGAANAVAAPKTAAAAMTTSTTARAKAGRRAQGSGFAHARQKARRETRNRRQGRPGGHRTRRPVKRPSTPGRGGPVRRPGAPPKGRR
jgi:23S rRNA pseudouridine955/2504/2580 synthase